MLSVESRLFQQYRPKIMKQAKRRTRYPEASLSPELDAIVDAEVQEKGYSNHPEAMKAFSAYLRAPRHSRENSVLADRPKD